jgi:hypothetical protein
MLHTFLCFEIAFSRAKGRAKVQAPTRIELVIDLKTAKASGLTITPPLFAAANQAIE